MFDPDLTHTGFFTEKHRVNSLATAYPFSVSECLLQQISHLCCRFFLYLVRGVGIGSKGESGTAVTEHTGYGLDIDAILQGKGREGVTQIMEADGVLWL